MKRTKDWEAKLHAYIQSKRDVPFAWVTNDCASFAREAVFAMTGARIALPVVETPEAYARFLRDHGSLREATRALLGAEIPAAFARRGDVVIVDLEDTPTLGICIGRNIAGPGKDGMVFAPRTYAVCAWRI